MKHQKLNVVVSSDENRGAHCASDLIDCGIWEGYEFWSAQLEAEMELLDEQATNQEFQRDFRLARLSAVVKERNGDVFPF